MDPSKITKNTAGCGDDFLFCFPERGEYPLQSSPIILQELGILGNTGVQEGKSHVTD